MIGRKGSGKTSFLGGIHDTFVDRHCEGFRIKPKSLNSVEADTISKSRLYLGQLSQLSIREKGFTKPTQDSTLWLLQLLYNEEVMCDFEWIDYRGGAIDDAFSDANAEDSAEITAHIGDSEAVMVFVDSMYLNYFSHDKDDMIHFTGAQKIYHFFDTMLEEFEDNEGLTLLFVLTKADSPEINPELVKYDFAGLKNLLKEAFETTINLGKRKNWKMAVVPTGVVGKGKVETIINDSLKDLSFQHSLLRPGSVTPMNIDAALFHCIESIMETRKSQLTRNVMGIQNEIEHKLQQSHLLKDWWSKMKGQKTPKQIAQELMNIRQIESHKLDKIEQVVKKIAEKHRNEVTRL